MTRNAIRITSNLHSAESVAFTVKRYGAIRPETLAEIVAWMDSPEGKADRVYEIINESILDEGELLTFPVIKTHRLGSANEHDAQNTLANIRNKDFPKNKQGS